MSLGGCNTAAPQHTHRHTSPEIHKYSTVTHILIHILTCVHKNSNNPLHIHIHARRRARVCTCPHTNTQIQSRLVQINCFPVVEGLSWGTLREKSAAHDAVSPSLVLYLKEIYLFDAILPSFGIHQVEYLSRDQKKRERGERRERTREGVMTNSRNGMIEKQSENRKRH